MSSRGLSCSDSSKGSAQVLLRRVALSSVGLLSGVLFVALGSGAGCTHDRPPEEAKLDASLPDVTTEVSTKMPALTVLVDGVDQPADISCNGKPRPDAGPIYVDSAAPDTAVADAADAEMDADDAAIEDVAPSDAATPSSDAGPPPIGTIVDQNIELIAFGTGGADKLPGQVVDIFYSNTLLGAPDVTSVVADDKSILHVKVPYGLRVGYHVKSNSVMSDFWALDDPHTPIAPIPLARWQGITRERQDLLALAITGEKDYTIKPNTGIISARVVDCEHRYVAFAKISLRDYTDDPAGRELTFGKCGQGLCIVYLTDSELPDPARTYTSRSSIFAMIDVPSNRKLAIFATGISADGKLVEFARRMLEVKEGAITFEYLEPSNEVKF